MRFGAAFFLVVLGGWSATIGGEASLSRIVSSFDYRYVPAVASRGDHLLLLDTYNHRLLWISEKTHGQDRQVGWIGQDQGSLFTPFDFTLLPGGRVAILDNEGRNLEVFSEQGRSERRISLPGVANSLAADSSGHVLVSLPGGDNFIKVIGEDGRVLRSFGSPRKFSDFYGPRVADRDARFGRWINRCKIAVDPSNNVYVAFEAAPVVQKYDSRGVLLFERQIEGPEAAEIVEGVRIKKKSPVVHGYWGDGLSLPYIVTGVTFDRLDNELIVLLLWDRMWIKRIGESGHVRQTLDIADHHLLLQKPFADSQNGRVLFATLSSKLGSGIYEMTLGKDGSQGGSSNDSTRKEVK